jgi:hypothetical protein
MSLISWKIKKLLTFKEDPITLIMGVLLVYICPACLILLGIFKFYDGKIIFSFLCFLFLVIYLFTVAHSIEDD